MTAAVETQALSKRYRRVSALTECTVTVPEGRVSALAGRTARARPRCCGSSPNWPARPAARLACWAARRGRTRRSSPRSGTSPRRSPLYRRFTATDHIRIGAHMNPRWDASLARTRLEELRIPLDQRVGTLSGGQRAQVALALTLAKRPRLLLLDEPVAALDPLARRNFLATLTAARADAAGDLTVVLSSHLVTDLERVCDHIIMLAGSRVQLCGDIDALLAEHKLLIGPRKDTAAVERAHTVVQAAATARQSTLLVRLGAPVIDPAYQAEDVTLEELVLAYMGAEEMAAGKHLTTVGEAS